MKTEIHCPISGCLYSVGSERHFTEKKFLNQHIAKVHAEKKYSCAKCKKSFGLDWWRRHHEKTCGIEWECSCGVKYASRETLLTHARRNQHKLPDNVLSTDKVKSSKMNKSTAENPVVVVIQPIIQNFTCIQPPQSYALNQRPILPKVTQPLLFSLPINMSTMPTLTNTMVSPRAVDLPTDATGAIKIQAAPSPDSSMLPKTNAIFESAKYANKNVSGNSQKSTATQTPSRFDNPSKVRLSQASQCSRRAAKSMKTGIESTHTQTAESTLVKIKKKRSRRKSVAIITEPSLLTNQNVGQSLWPGFKDFFTPDAHGVRSSRNVSTTTSTQTSSHKTLCDSETITDEDFLKMHWNSSEKEKNLICNSSFEGLSEIVSRDSVAGALPEKFNHDTLSVIDMFSDSMMKTFPESVEEKSMFQSSSNKSSECDSSSLLSVFTDCSKQDISNKIPQPTLSDIHTQTIASSVLDYNLLANMETQTTDEFTLSDLEFSDTETQTPWEDFPNIDSPLQTDQLSIEIQTDFSSFSQDLNQDPFDFINGMDVQNIIGCSSKECLGVNSETQTQDKFNFPQFTNTESQTLDISDFVFD
ncbi:ATM interactor-like [Uloborus diversus]|uniref:ATM interactor-like n=1 Tax=Uloborus diversus TaxID=327109 RepID=UPI0024090BA9|nr:ATM interactor-like [Uloborus diversus]